MPASLVTLQVYVPMSDSMTAGKLMDDEVSVVVLGGIMRELLKYHRNELLEGFPPLITSQVMVTLSPTATLERSVAFTSTMGTAV